MSNSVINIVIPTLNEEDNLKFLLPYLINECQVSSGQIFVSDSPFTKDKTKVIAESYCVNYILTNASCRAHQMNKAAFETNSEVLAFLHADVIPPTNFTSLIKKSVLEGNMFGFFAYKFNTRHPLLKINAYFTKYDGIFVGGGDQLHFIKRETFVKLGGFNPKFKIMEDFELVDRIKNNNIKYNLLPQKVIVSDRKYKNRSYLWVNLVQLYIFIKYKIGTPPAQLAKIYSKL
jgi:predicted glycosyltransferase involved in capsule biosynthesis